MSSASGRLVELRSGEVHRHPDVLGGRQADLPRFELETGLAQGPLAQRHDEAGLLGDWDELRGEIRPGSGAATGPGLESGDAVRGQGDHRLKRSTNSPRASASTKSASNWTSVCADFSIAVSKTSQRARPSSLAL